MMALLLLLNDDTKTNFGFQISFPNNMPLVALVYWMYDIRNCCVLVVYYPTNNRPCILATSRRTSTSPTIYN